VATMITSGSRGTDDPTMATLPFMAAKTAKEQGHDVILWLWNESVTLGRKGTADHVTGVNLTPLKELLAAMQVPVFRSGSAAPAHSPGRSGRATWCPAPRSRACRTISKRWRNVIATLRPKGRTRNPCG
jgi:DsrE/DsrF/DsrH-like protein